ncbi:hypothetical protein I308_105532 [Cryptococcus tetragattii IND107]|uniref:EF-hand domain-containing protein n=1 Tax=Cryptococcus tetragattii IND107 TaxID=1296105 RepID=A0ABR3BL88_9TREE
MSGRPRRAAAASSRHPAPTHTVDLQGADPEFLALSLKQRRAIDKAFEKGVRSIRGGEKRKRRKIANGKAVNVELGAKDEGGIADESGGGGFLEEDGRGGPLSEDPDEFVAEGDAGGFVIDDDAGGLVPGDDQGGFLPEDDAGGFVSDGGYQDGVVSEDSKHLEQQLPSHYSSQTFTKLVPLYLLPTLLTSLGLPSDEDVLQVFRASAMGWDESSNKRALDTEGAAGVELKDFRAVCAALMDPDDGEEMEDVELGSNDDDDDKDNFEPSGEESALTSLSESSYGGTPNKNRSKTARNTSGKTRVKGKGVLEDQISLSSNQRVMVRDIWDMLIPSEKQEKFGADILGRNEVKELVRTLGEMWSDEEITDMVTLFSSQHEGRGLTFEDFGKVMLRAGLV